MLIIKLYAVYMHTYAFFTSGGAVTPVENRAAADNDDDGGGDVDVDDHVDEGDPLIFEGGGGGTSSSSLSSVLCISAIFALFGVLASADQLGNSNVKPCQFVCESM